MSWSIRSWLRQRSRAARKRRQFRPTIETCEQRIVPSGVSAVADIVHTHYASVDIHVLNNDSWSSGASISITSYGQGSYGQPFQGGSLVSKSLSSRAVE